jgi:malate synthase
MAENIKYPSQYPRVFSQQSVSLNESSSSLDIPYYADYISKQMLDHLLSRSCAVEGVAGLYHVGSHECLEPTDGLNFLCQLYDTVKLELKHVLQQRMVDRSFLDQRTQACYDFNASLNIDFLDPNYETVIGHEDAKGRIVWGPLNEFYHKPGYGKPIAHLPSYLRGAHVTLFGPPDTAKLSINAMNSFHRKLPDEPEVIARLNDTQSFLPKWGADDEDSKTPLRGDLVDAANNLSGCFDRTLSYSDPVSHKEYKLAETHLASPIKRFPGLALPSLFMFYQNQPLPLHLYDFALHLWRHWRNPEALAFYVPKLENEEEARYLRHVLVSAEQLLQLSYPEYVLGSIRILVVLENPRAVFRVNEIMDELHPYFAGASLGWHDYLASTARLFKNDANYRLPVKADPNIVIRSIAASHHLLAAVVGSRGGLKIGGMYGVLPVTADLRSDSFQVCMKGFIKDVVTQLKRGLEGFWVAHPDFVRIGLALVESFRLWRDQGDHAPLRDVVTSLLDSRYHEEVLSFINDGDRYGVDISDPMYARALIVAAVKESTFISNSHPDEVRYNVFQAMQYLADWLSGNGCVALPAQIGEVVVVN